MRKNCFSIWLLIIAVFWLASCAHISHDPLLKNPHTLVFKQIQHKVPRPQRLAIDNGMVIYLLEDHELPLIEVSALIRTGAIYEPAEYAGLASLTGEVLRTGGTKALAPEKIDETLEYIDAQIAFSIDTESGSATLSVIKKDFDLAFDVFSQMLRTPRFAPERLAIAKEQKISALRQINDNPQSLAFREFKKFLYGTNPRGNLPTIDTIKRIESHHLYRFYQAHFQPNRIILGVSGDFSSEQMIATIKKVFGDWKSYDSAIPAIAPPSPVAGRRLYYLEKKVPQSTILIGKLAPPKQNPDYYAFEILNYILGGGGFSSLLTSEIRSNRGLAYSVGSFYRADVDYGVFAAYAITKSASTAEVYELMRDLMKRTDNMSINEELKKAQESLINSFIFSYTSSAQIVAQTMVLEYEHLPSDFLEQYPQNIKRVTLGDVRRVAQMYLNPDHSVSLIVGDAESFDKPLSWFGPVQRVFSDIK
jgi:predicted Zn-dependent peptidase